MGRSHPPVLEERMHRLALLLLLLLLLSACSSPRAGGGGSDDDDSAADDDDATGDDDDATGDDDDATGDGVDATGDDDDSTPAGPITIADLTSGAVPLDTEVTLSEVTVTSPPIVFDENDDGLFWVQDGGQRGDGIVVYTYTSVLDAEPDLLPGSTYSVTGIFEEGFDVPQLRVTDASDLDHLGDSPLPAPVSVNASELDDGVSSDPLLLGMLARLSGAEVESGPHYSTFGQWSADGVLVDDAWVWGDVDPGYDVNVTGIVHSSFGEVVMLPRSEADLDFEHPGCGAWTASSDARALNCREVEPQTEVTVVNLVVTSGEPFYGDAFYAQRMGADVFAGLQIFGATELTLPPIGSVVAVTGLYEEYRGQSEVVVLDSGDLVETGSSSVEPGLVFDPCDLSEGDEGMIRWFPIVPVLPQDSDASDFGYVEVAGCPNVRVDAQFFGSNEDFNSLVDTGPIEDLVGIVSESLGVVRISPRNADDWVSWD